MEFFGNLPKPLFKKEGNLEIKRKIAPHLFKARLGGK